MRLSDCSVLVTGGSTGIGRATVRRLAAAGARIKVAALPGAELESLRDEFGEDRVDLRGGNLADEDFVREVALWGEGADILIHSAGLARLAPFLEAEMSDWRLMHAVNFAAGLSIAQSVARGMAARRRGKIILISSAMADWVNVNAIGYAATKHALSAARKGLRQELAPYGIQVTEIRPGLVGDTAINSGHKHPAVAADFEARSYAPIKSDDIARAVMFVAETPPEVDIPLIEVKPVGQG